MKAAGERARLTPTCEYRCQESHEFSEGKANGREDRLYFFTLNDERRRWHLQNHGEGPTVTREDVCTCLLYYVPTGQRCPAREAAEGGTGPAIYRARSRYMAIKEMEGEMGFGRSYAQER